jgi:hypothetical protein
MSEQLALDEVRGPDQGTLERATKPLTHRQQLAFDYVRERDGVSADEVGAFLHAHRDKRPHGVDARCTFCTRDGRSVLTSVALKPLVTYRRVPGGRLYIARDKADRVRVPEPVREPTEAELEANPFAGLGVSSTAFEGDA